MTTGNPSSDISLSVSIKVLFRCVVFVDDVEPVREELHADEPHDEKLSLDVDEIVSGVRAEHHSRSAPDFDISPLHHLSIPLFGFIGR